MRHRDVIQIETIDRPAIDVRRIVETRKARDTAHPLWNTVMQKWLACELHRLRREFLCCRSRLDHDSNLMRGSRHLRFYVAHHRVAAINVEHQLPVVFGNSE